MTKDNSELLLDGLVNATERAKKLELRTFNSPKSGRGTG